MSKYEKLTQHLASFGASEWVAKFSEVEAVLGFKLPPSARMYAAWWSNQAGDGHIQSNAWQNVGWRTRDLDLGSGRVTFACAVPRSVSGSGVDAGPTTARGAPGTSYERGAAGGGQKVPALTMAEAKAGLAAYFGVPPESVEITIKG